MQNSFDAVLIIAFGGPQGPADVGPFLANVLRGRRVRPERIDEVAHHYELFGGISPLAELTRRQAHGLQTRLQERSAPMPVYVGMRNWHPYLRDTLAVMSRAGVRRAIGFIAAPHRSYSSCTQYRENVEEARAGLRHTALPDVEVTYVCDWHTHPGFVAANAGNVRAALERLPQDLRARAHVIFTAHSIPVAMAESYPYRQQVEATARRVAEAVDRNAPCAPGHRVRDHAVVYQSRSGRPEDPWLGPDVCDYLREAKQRGVSGVVLSPIGFLCDHVEVLYDLDVEAAQVCREIDLAMARAGAVNDHPAFLDTMADAVQATCERYAGGRPLQVVK